MRKKKGVEEGQESRKRRRKDACLLASCSDLIYPPVVTVLPPSICMPACLHAIPCRATSAFAEEMRGFIFLFYFFRPTGTSLPAYLQQQQQQQQAVQPRHPQSASERVDEG